MEKRCTKCLTIKLISDYPKNCRFPSGYNSICKQCINQINKNYRLNNSCKFKDSRKRAYQNNIEKYRAEKRKYYASNKEKKQKYDVLYRIINKDKIAAYKKAWEKLDRTKVESIIKRNLRRRIVHVIRGAIKSDSTMNLIGCTIEQFISHIESQFSKGMSWENYGRYGWHIDHIVECHRFDLSDPEQQKKCFHYSNQRPLWWTDNLTRPRK